MNIEKLRCFKTVAETKHLTHAAESLFMSQPALSKLMASLESELNISLYEKEGRNIVLTEAGRSFTPMLSPHCTNWMRGSWPPSTRWP